LEGVAVRREPMTRMRQLIADHMVESVRVSPHVTTVFEIDLHKVWDIREKYKDSFHKTEGFKLTLTHFFIHAAVQAIKKHPIVNTSVDGYDVLWKKDINMGCAVAIDNGLIVPVIKNAGDLNLLGIARRLNDLIVRARTKKLKAEDIQGGTFTVTNPGGWGSITSNPIINQPQVAILGIGAAIKRPVVVKDMIAIRPMMLMSLTFDHRVIDGEGGAKYLATLKEIIENYSDLPV
ncbi:MAG: 2-oxo acid dehydrogenase subunit E2, partial [Proteobacteria bacterium]